MSFIHIFSLFKFDEVTLRIKNKNFRRFQYL